QKCDCAHPVCNQCVRFGRERDCEYSEKDQRSRTEILEETISNLQARVRELESGSGPASGRRAAPPASGPAEQRSFSARFGGAELRPDVVRLVQCHVLLAHYFFTDGQFREGRQHTADAVSLVLLHQLHKIRSPRGRDASKTHLVGVGVAHTAMPPPADLIEEGERTHAFWHVYILDKIWASLLGCPSLLVEDGSPATEIDTPWPLALDQYADVSRDSSAL
ncbi:hypothetical protein PHLGIDRAFT_71064, partial [Phlebiopsis gigantea 11061_1 CR5-6]